MSFLTTWARFKRLAIGCCVMFFQQFMGCNGESGYPWNASHIAI